MQETKRDWLAYAAIGTALATGALILSPYLLPMLGIGNADLAEEAMSALHGTGLGDGLAGAINTALNAVPMVGETLAKGGLMTALASGVTGIGGVLLGSYVGRCGNGKKYAKFGKIIRTAALATSALIALPTMLTGISVGIVYLCAVASGVDLASSAVGLLSDTIGSVGAMNVAATGLSGAATALPHLLTCGVSALPAAITFGIWKKNKDEQPEQLSRPTGLELQITQKAPLRAGEICYTGLQVIDRATGLPVAKDEMAVTHTEKLHLFVVDKGLRDYHHLHPQATAQRGVFAFHFTPKLSGDYIVWADFNLMRDGSNHRLKNTMQGASRFTLMPAIRETTQAQAGALLLEWRSSTPLVAHEPTIVEIFVKDAHGRPVTDLEPVMGAFCHLVGFSANGNSLVHTHPLGNEPAFAQDCGGPRLRFRVEPHHAGPMQFFVQLRRGGQDIFVPFGQRVQPARKHSARTQSVPALEQHGHAH